MRTALAVVATAWVGAVAAGAETPGPAREVVAAPPESLQWSVDPFVPGPDLPPRGRSLFDLVVAGDARAVGDVPFPFPALVDRVAAMLRPDAQGAAPIRAVLIPLGRSLQRNAAAPDFFASPRIVAAVDGETREGGAAGGIALRDRLYLGYQPRANVIEVISYNEAAGRFEFQVVSDYRAGGRATVRYARRAVCMACHQNGGPIFSRGLWNETNANPRVAAALSPVRPRFEGVDVARGVDTPDAIDAAVRRSNRIAAQQWLWRHGCAAVGDREREIRCRGQALLAATRYRLSGRQGYDASARRHRESVVDALAALKDDRGGGGLAIPDPGLPNRDPMQEIAAGTHSADDYTGASNVTAAYDPLAPRPPLEVWPFADADFVSRQLVAGVADFFTDSDVRRLDAGLRAAAAAGAPSRRESVFACEIAATRGEGRRRRIAFECAAPQAGARGSARLEGAMLVEDARVDDGSVDRLSFPDADAEPLRNIAIAGGSFATRHGRSVATLEIARSGAPVRRGDGSAVGPIRLVWTALADREASTLRATGEARVGVVDDFAPLVRAVAALERAARDGTSDALSAEPFRRAAVLAALERELGLPPRRFCCAADRAPPGPIGERSPVVAGDDPSEFSSEERTFHRYCALCHRSADPAPPNFLDGTPRQVRANLAHCAQRLHVRLAMWERSGSERTKTPMPPPTTLDGARIGEAAWRAGADLAALRGYVAKLLRAEGARAESGDALLRSNYEHLRECLPRAG